MTARTGGARRARTAAPLVLHGRDRALSRPVDRVIKGLADALEVDALGILGRLVEVEVAHVALLELLPRQVREGVVAQPVRQVLGVVLLDDVVVGDEHAERGSLLLDGGVDLVLGALPRLELAVDGHVGREAERGDDGVDHGGGVLDCRTEGSHGGAEGEALPQAAPPSGAERKLGGAVRRVAGAGDPYVPYLLS